MNLDDMGWDRAERENTSAAIPCEVTAVYLDGEPKVKIRPLANMPYDAGDALVVSETPLEVDQIPYVYPCSTAFTVFVPPSIGMQGFLVITQGEVGEAADGEILTSRRQDARSGYFVPGGRLNGTPFKGNANWAEMRSKACRVAMSANTVHLQAGNTSIVLTKNGFDVVSGGVSLVAALKQMSAHIKVLEALVHPNGNTHGPVKSRLVDSMSAATPPARSETGV